MTSQTPVAGPAGSPADGPGFPETGAPGGLGGLRARIRNSRYGTWLVLAVTAALVMGAAYLVQGSHADAADPVVTGGRADLVVGSRAPDFRARTITGDPVSLREFRGGPVWLTFGASWCAQCQAEAVDIEAAHLRHAAAGLTVLGVFLAEDDATVRDYAQRVGLTYPAVADPDQVIADSYRVLGIPVHVFIDSQGVIRQVETGALTPEKMDQALDGLT
jgi:cytochrome c biogenesis protein CcmG/thiol:disulfide interchange protein DsbE